jgi:hypothetical protein
MTCFTTIMNKPISTFWEKNPKNEVLMQLPPNFDEFLIQRWKEEVLKNNNHAKLGNETLFRELTEDNFIHAISQLKGDLYSLSLPENPSPSLLYNIFAYANLFHHGRIKSLSFYVKSKLSAPETINHMSYKEDFSIKNFEEIEKNLKQNTGLVIYDLPLDNETISFLINLISENHSNFGMLVILSEKSKYFSLPCYQYFTS